MINSTITYNRIVTWSLSLLMMLSGFISFAKEDPFPGKPSPPRLVNDYAGMLTTSEEERLEHKLENFARTTSTQITVVTIKNLGGYDVSDYSFKLFNKWGVGQEGKNNGVLLLVSLEDRKSFIAPGRGLEGALTDAQSGRILRNELKPAFKAGNYFAGLESAADAIIAATKGEYTADKDVRGRHIPAKAIIILIIFIFLIMKMMGRGGGGGGGYMSHRGAGDIATGFLLGSMLGGGRSGSGWGDSGGGGFGGGGFGGFGGGSSGGGGAGGSW